MKKLLLVVLAMSLCGFVWADTSIEFMVESFDPEPVGSLQVEATQAIVDIFEDNDVDAKYLKLVRDFDFVPGGVKADITEVIKDDTDDVLDKIKAELKLHLIPGKVEYVYMLIGNRLFSATIGER